MNTSAEKKYERYNIIKQIHTSSANIFKKGITQWNNMNYSKNYEKKNI